MRVLVDGDGCPDRDGIKEICQRYQVDMIVFCDYAHMIEDDYFITMQCEVGHDNADHVLYDFAKEGDLAITQDYGLASLLLMKKVDVLHTSGKPITTHNIDNLLASRYMGQKIRKANKHVKGPKKRTYKESENLLLQVERWIVNHKDFT